MTFEDTVNLLSCKGGLICCLDQTNLRQRLYGGWFGQKGRGEIRRKEQTLVVLRKQTTVKFCRVNLLVSIRDKVGMTSLGRVI